MRLNFLLTLLGDCQKHLEPSLLRANNLIVSYKLPMDAAIGLLTQNDRNKAKLEGEGLMTTVVQQFEALDESKQGLLIN